MTEETKIKITEVGAAAEVKPDAYFLITQTDALGTARLYRAQKSVVAVPITNAQITAIVATIS